jgi:dTDP-glucose 4,6-dehydratase
VLDLLTYAGSRARLSDVLASGRCELVIGDVCEPESVGRAMAGCGAVAHFAAETHVDRSIVAPAPFIRTNVEGTYTVMQEAHRQGIGSVVHVSTDEVYGPVPGAPVDESAPLLPTSPYAASKAAADLLIRAFESSAKPGVIIVRPTNIYGPWQLPEKFIPLCITRCLNQEPVPVYGDGLQRRAWLHVDDACEAISTVLAHGRSGEVYNIGSGAECANAELARRIARTTGAPEDLIRLVEDRPGHDRRYAMSDARMRALGWTPRITFEQGLEGTIEWYRAHAGWWRPIVQQLRERADHWFNWALGSGAAGAVPDAG